MFGGIYKGRRVLVTGHTGFKGSWLTLWLRFLGAEVSGLALNPSADFSHWSTLNLSGVTDRRVDLRDSRSVRQVLEDCQPEMVFHLAAQPLVRRSYRSPADTFATNVMGLVHLYEAVRNCPSTQVLVNATTDKVYADRASECGYVEGNALGGHDPYSASKACAELVSDCYRKSFFQETVRIATARAGNVIGGGDWAEDRLLPDLVRAAFSGQALKVRNPDAIRPWQHVLEPLSGYLCLGQRLWTDPDLGGAWNFGPEASGEVTVKALVERLTMHWPALQMDADRAEHPHEALTLRLNWDKARDQLKWRPVWDIDTALAKTAAWYREFQKHGTPASKDDLTSYIDDAQRR